MKIRFLTMTSSLAAFAALASLACSARTLDIGSTDGGSPGSGGSGGSGGGSTAYTGGCTAASCSNQSAQCSSPEGSSSGATPVSLRCAPDPFAGQGSDPAGTCILSFECSTPGAGTAPDGGKCPAWTTPGTATTCGSSSGACVSGATAAGGPGTGVVSVELDPASNGSAASTILAAYFTYSFGSSSGTAPFGDCIYDPEGADRTPAGPVQGAPATNPGPITAKGPTLSVTATPVCDGTYDPTPTSQSFAAGDVVTFAWLPPPSTSAYGTPTFPAALPQVPAPHLIALAAGQALAPASPTIARAKDVAVTWTVTGTPMALEQVVVRLAQGKAAVTCAFDASAGSGVVPADALLNLSAAVASYGVYSQHAGEVKSTGSSWDVQFLVEEMAVTPTGIAKGTLVLQ